MSTETDDLVARLRAASGDERLSTGALYREAADAIEALERELDTNATDIMRLQGELAEARGQVAALREALEDLPRRMLHEAGCTYMHDLKCQCKVGRSRQALADTTSAAAEWRARVRREAMEEALACVPGGSVCDPQQVADAIRAQIERTG